MVFEEISEIKEKLLKQIGLLRNLFVDTLNKKLESIIDDHNQVSAEMKNDVLYSKLDLEHQIAHLRITSLYSYKKNEVPHFRKYEENFKNLQNILNFDQFTALSLIENKQPMINEELEQLEKSFIKFRENCKLLAQKKIDDFNINEAKIKSKLEEITQSLNNSQKEMDTLMDEATYVYKNFTKVMTHHEEIIGELNSQKLTHIESVLKLNKNKGLSPSVDFEEFNQTKIVQDIISTFSKEAIQLQQLFDQKIVEEKVSFNKIKDKVIILAEKIKSKLLILSKNVEDYQKNQQEDLNTFLVELESYQKNHQKKLSILLKELEPNQNDQQDPTLIEEDFFAHSSREKIEQKSSDDSVKSLGFFLEQQVHFGAQGQNFSMNTEGFQFHSSQASNDMDPRSHIKQEASVHSNELISNLPDSTSKNTYFKLLADYALGNIKRLNIFKFPEQVAAMLEEVQQLDPAVLKVLCLNIATVSKLNYKIIDLFWGKLLNSLNDESKVPLYKDILEASLETLYSSIKITMDEAGYWQNFRKKRDVFLAHYKKLSTPGEYEKLFLKYEKEPIDEAKKEEIFSKFNTYYIKGDDEGHTRNVGIGEYWTKYHPIIIEAIKNLTDEKFIALTKRVLNNGKQSHTFFKTFFTAISNDLEIVDKPSYQKAVEECRALINIKKDDLFNQLQNSLKNEENKPYHERNTFEGNIRNHIKSWDKRLITLNNVSPKMIIKITPPLSSISMKRSFDPNNRFFKDEPETQEIPVVKQHKTYNPEIDLIDDPSAFNFNR